MSRRRVVLTSLAVLASLVGLADLQAADAFVVIVHKDNPVASLSRAEASDLFLKKRGKWRDGVAVEPADQDAASATREAFSEAIHKRDSSAIASYWQRQIFTGRSVPPPIHASDEDMLAFVRGRRGAIGYVAASAVDASVRVVAITE